MTRAYLSANVTFDWLHRKSTLFFLFFFSFFLFSWILLFLALYRVYISLMLCFLFFFFFSLLFSIRFDGACMVNVCVYVPVQQFDWRPVRNSDICLHLGLVRLASYTVYLYICVFIFVVVVVLFISLFSVFSLSTV